MNTSNKEVSKKKVYSSPQLTVHGDIEDITQGSDLGNSADAAFTTAIVGDHDGGKKTVRSRSERFS